MLEHLIWRHNKVNNRGINLGRKKEKINWFDRGAPFELTGLVTYRFRRFFSLPPFFIVVVVGSGDPFLRLFVENVALLMRLSPFPLRDIQTSRQRSRKENKTITVAAAVATNRTLLAIEGINVLNREENEKRKKETGKTVAAHF